MLEVNELHFNHPGRATLFSGLNFVARPGKVLALIGRNGAGKSTLIRLLNGLSKPSQGRVVLDGQDLTAQRPDQLASLIGTLFQVPEQQIFHESVYREVAFGLQQAGHARHNVRHRVTETLQRTGLVDEANRHPLDLDHASRRLVALASILALSPRVILLDEPQRGLDARACSLLSSLIEQERRQDRIQILICHDMEFVARHADEVLAINPDGRYFHGDCSAFFSDPALPQTMGVSRPLSIELCQRLGLPPEPRLEKALGQWLG